MAFTETQLGELGAGLRRSHIKKNPKGFDYIEGWHAIAEANRIFGFDGWDRQTLEMVQLGEPELVGATWRVAYRCRVKIIVRAGDAVITRDGTGYGSGIVKDIRDAHESAAKEAETDAMKRALMTFGNQFGLALYDKVQANVEPLPETSEERFVKETLAKIKTFADTQSLKAWWTTETPVRERFGFVQGTQEYSVMFNAFRAHGVAISPPATTKEAA